MSTYIVTSRIDGRGGIKPFGTYGKAQAGAKVDIGGRLYTVTKDGRVNIPKSIMKNGVKGIDGRYRIAITFSIPKGKDGWKNVKSIVNKPLRQDKNKKQGTIVTKHRLKKRNEIEPKDVNDVNWSP